MVECACLTKIDQRLWYIFTSILSESQSFFVQLWRNVKNAAIPWQMTSSKSTIKHAQTSYILVVIKYGIIVTYYGNHWAMLISVPKLQKSDNIIGLDKFILHLVKWFMQKIVVTVAYPQKIIQFFNKMYIFPYRRINIAQLSHSTKTPTEITVTKCRKI